MQQIRNTSSWKNLRKKRVHFNQPMSEFAFKLMLIEYKVERKKILRFKNLKKNIIIMKILSTEYELIRI